MPRSPVGRSGQSLRPPPDLLGSDRSGRYSADRFACVGTTEVSFEIARAPSSFAAASRTDLDIGAKALQGPVDRPVDNYISVILAGLRAARPFPPAGLTGNL